MNDLEKAWEEHFKNSGLWIEPIIEDEKMIVTLSFFACIAYIGYVLIKFINYMWRR